MATRARHPQPDSRRPPAASTGQARPAAGAQRVQMADIARLAGVSLSTVSRALSGSKLIPASTRERIVELARACDYHVDSKAASLRKRDVDTVGVAILSDSMQVVSDPFLLSILGAIADDLDQRGMSLLLSRMHPDRKDWMPNMVHGGKVAGLIVIGQVTMHQYLNEMVDSGLPMAVWGALLPDARYPVVGGDNDTGGYLATRHLIERGCRHIAFFGDVEQPEIEGRHAGYARALAEAGLQADPRLHVPRLFGEGRIRGSIDEWIDQGVPFDGVFASADVTAISVIAALNARGIHVPGDVKVVGYDDISMAAYFSPALTTVRQPTDVAGRVLVDLLFEAIARQPRRSVLLPAELVVRASTG